MARYKLSKVAKEDLIRIHQYGVVNFGEAQADTYFNDFFDKFELIAEQPLQYQAVDYIRKGYRRCPCGVDCIYFRLNSEKVVEIMAIIGRQDFGGL